MNASERLLRLFDFDHWANDKALNILTDDQDESLKLMSHILAAQELWYNRIIGADLSGLKVWPLYSLKECKDISTKWPEKWSSLINKNSKDLDRIISYKNTSGNAYNTMLSDILHHVIIHGQHHRAQIATLLRQSGNKPPATDFIFYAREQ
ncbi:MAG: DinB family protein [Balneolaceae bacterium]|nr:DinB family protein [Balneolaceae bacterium]